MARGSLYVPMLLLGFSLTLSLFTLYTSPSVEEEQLRKRSSSRRSDYHYKLANSMVAENTENVQRGASQWTQTPNVYLMKETHEQSRRVNSERMKAPNQMSAQPKTVPFAVSFQPARSKLRKKESGRRGWVVLGTVLVVATVLGVIVALPRVQSWSPTSESALLLHHDDDSDYSQYSTGVAYTNSPRDVGYGTIVIPWTGDSFDKFDL